MARSLDELLEGVPHEARRRPAYTEFRLEPAPEAEYFFSVWLYSDGEAHIAARRVSAPEKELFWYQPLELHDFRDADELQATLVAEAARIFRNPTRIVQRRGILFWSFHLEFLEDGEWHRVSGYLTPRWSRDVPSISGKERIYSSAPPPSTRTHEPYT